MKRWFFPYLRPWLWYVFFSVILIFVVQGFRVYRPMLQKEILEFSQIQALDQIIYFGWIYLGVVFLNHFFQLIQGFLISFVGVSVTLKIREDVFSHLLKIPYSWFLGVKSGSLIVRTGLDVETIGEGLSGSLLRLISDLLAIFAILIILFSMNFRLSVISVTGLVIMVWVTQYMGKFMQKWMMDSKKLMSRIATRFSEILQGLFVIRLMGVERGIFADFSKLSREYTRENHKINLLEPFFYGFVEFFTSLILAMILYDGVLQISSTQMSYAQLVAFISYVQAMSQPLRHLSGMIHSAIDTYTSLTRIYKIMEVEPEKNLTENLICAENFEIKVEDLHFSYGQEPVLSGISFKICPGEKVALVGRTGAGKSTIFKLLNRFYLPMKGTIFLGGVDINLQDFQKIREKIGVVLQEVHLFSGTVEDNLCLFEEKWRKEAEKFARILYEKGWFLDGKNPKMIQNGGENCSVGERQLLAFGRVFIKNAEIFLLDEATSNIDTKTEFFLQELLQDFLKEKSAVVIAHRLSTIRKSDRILVLKSGKIVEEGGFEELLDKKGEFYEYFRHQYKEFASEGMSVSVS